MKRRGRPEGSTSPTAKRRLLRLRCTDQDLDRWRQAAARVDLTFSAWVRERLNKAAKRG